MPLQYIATHPCSFAGVLTQAAARHVRGYFITNQSIHLLTRVGQIEFPADGEARAKVLVSRDAAAAADSLDLASLATDLYEFKLALRREDGEWQVTFAEWLRKQAR